MRGEAGADAGQSGGGRGAKRGRTRGEKRGERCGVKRGEAGFTWHRALEIDVEKNARTCRS